MPGYRFLSSLVLSTMFAFAFAGCASDTETSETGGLSLELVLVDDVTINTVQWRITGNGMDMSDSINVSAPGSTASVEVFGLPRGIVDYTIELEAMSVDESVTCRGSEPFNVEAGETTNVMVILHCKLPQRLGAVRVNGKFNICAELAKAVVSPLQTSVGNDIDLSAIGVDRDEDPITYSWTGTGGTIDDPSAAVTKYTCVDVGDHFVNISVTDNDEVCDMAEWTIAVTCVPGDGLECINDEDCDTGEVCVDNECVPDLECIDDDGCDAGEACVDNECVPVLECDDDDGCDEGEICVDNECVPDLECINDDGCDVGEVCVDNECVPDIECINDDGCDVGEVCVDNECVPDIECTNDEGCDDGEVCIDNECVPDDRECAGNGDCDDGEICVNDECRTDPVLFCDEGICATDEQARLDCEVAFVACLLEEPINEDECVVVALLECNECNMDNDCGAEGICEDNACVECRDVTQCPGGGECMVAACESDNTCSLSNAPDGTMCLDGGGECMNGTCEITSTPVIGEGSGSTDWQAVPTTATGCTYDSVDTICTDCTITGPSKPGGGQCGPFGVQIVRGCEVPGGVLNAQLAIDVTVSLDVVSDGAGNLDHAITIRAENPALGTAAGLVSVDGAEILSSVTTGVPAQLSNFLNPALAGDILGLFTGGSNVLLLDDDPTSVPSNTNNGVEILPDSTAVTPTSSPTVDVNFTGDFLLQLTIQSSGTPLDVDAASCTFDSVGAPITLPVL